MKLAKVSAFSASSSNILPGATPSSSAKAAKLSIDAMANSFDCPVAALIKLVNWAACSADIPVFLATLASSTDNETTSPFATPNSSVKASKADSIFSASNKNALPLTFAICSWIFNLAAFVALTPKFSLI